MALRYGSENPESEAFARRVVQADRRAPTKSKKTKQAAAAVGASLLAGAALLGYQSERSGSSTTMLRAETASTDLSANFDLTNYEVPGFLRGNPQIVVFSASKPDYCLDDGGARKGALSEFKAEPCQATSVNQVFVFDESNLMLRSAKKADLCMSGDNDGVVHMAECDLANPDQRFVYDETNIQFRNPNTDQCLDVSGDTFHMTACDDKNPDQQLTILWQNEVGGPVDDYQEPEKPSAPLLTQPMDTTTPEGEPQQQQYYNPDESVETNAPVEETPTEIQHEYQNEVDEENQDGPAPGDFGGYIHPEEPVPIAEEPHQEYNEPIAEQPHEEYNEPAPIAEEPTYGMPPQEEPIAEEPHQEYNEPIAEQPHEEYNEPAPIAEEGPVTDETRDGDVAIPVDIVEDVTTGYLDPVTQAPEPFDATNPKPVFTDFKWTDLNGDWNLLAPSKLTIGPVNSDGSSDITSDEIFSYLEGIKSTAETQLELTLSKYRRTFKCASDGLESFAKTSLSSDEYHELVSWMYAHCAFDNSTPAPQDESPPDRVYMTKLEFYQQIKDHFTATRAELFGQAEGAKLRSEVSTVDRDRLLECIEQAAARFSNYDDADVFHSAVLWVQDQCMAK